MQVVLMSLSHVATLAKQKDMAILTKFASKKFCIREQFVRIIFISLRNFVEATNLILLTDEKL